MAEGATGDVGTGRRLAFLLGVLATIGCDDGPTSIEPGEPWRTVSPDEVELDAGRLEAAHMRATGNEWMRSLLVVRHGRLAFERYYGGFGPDSLADLRSVTKSVVSTLAGIAIARGEIPGVDTPVSDFVNPDDFGASRLDEAITFRHLLTMIGGWEWDESGGGDYAHWESARDPVRFLLDRPIVNPPGTRFVYNSAGVHLLGVAVAEATGESLPDFADEVLFGPLGIPDSAWELLSGGFVNGGSGLDLRPRDLARFGQLFLMAGRWRGRAVVPEDWIEMATAPVFTWSSPRSYGYLWWIDLERGAYYASGYGGQYLYVLPGRDLVVVVTTDWRGAGSVPGYRDAIRALRRLAFDIIVNDVVPAAR